MKDFFAGKKIGFYVTLAAAVLAVLTAIIYAVNYSYTNYMSWGAFWLLLVGAVAAVALAYFNFSNYAPVVLYGLAVVALMLFVYNIYFFLSSVAVGIQYSGIPVDFVVTAVFYGLTVIASMVAIFMPKTAEE